MRFKWKLSLLALLSLILIAFFMLTDAGGNWDYILPRRGMKILAMVITGGTIAVSTVIFQTITNNRILTPSILGLDSLYMLLQTAAIFLVGSGSAMMMNRNLNFLLTVVAMVLFSGLLYRLLFKKEGSNIYFLLLLGLIFGTFFSSISTFMQVLIDPNEFLMVQDRMFASFNNIHTDLVWVGLAVIALGTVFMWPFLKYLDVLSLGKDQAINLGVDYDRVMKRLFLIIAVFISIATALVGPITFLGLLVANVTYEFMKTYKHSYLFAASILISIIALVGGQLLVERVFTFTTTLSVIINFTGGVYFLYLLLRERS
ncbi:iron chelate uptake ABC transporter family permease subunit [Jeotgalibacillus campisalis]|uniref:Iron ABC transporter permease n=1 Tax=Jeotgalibacillus campisalis TaxID=220754 RepID=A0A0C2W4L7_9BACL|nr:iron chelate uptake ABC transporter family permease subunit [Jeotgalibacillus campisalis]KIL50988.1 iron ABC transporter permease [Jeotgalibacillus campisalis]